MIKKDVLLPFEDKPYTIAYQNSAFPMGIIQANAREDIDPWLASKYINCRYHPGNIFDICITDKWFCEDGKLLYQRVNLAKNLYADLSVDYIQLLREIIDLGFYPNGIYNEEYIPGKDNFQNSYFAHDYLLIGYNDEEQVFYSVGYLADRKFQRFIIPYGSMKQSLQTLKEPSIPFYILKYNVKAKYVFDTDAFLQDLSDYINSKTSVKSFHTDTYFGMQAIHEMAKDLLSRAKQKRRIDNRYTRALMEHKSLMVKRINYLINEVGVNLSKIQENATKVHTMAETIHLLGLKYLMTRDFSIAERIFELINKMLVLESEYLPVLHDRVKDAQSEGLL